MMTAIFHFLQRKRQKMLTLGVIFLILGVFIQVSRFGFYHIAYAQEREITGVDVVFVVDQSGSMGGKAFGSDEHPLPNDPNGLRFKGVQEMVERLAAYRINYFHDTDVRFNISVIYFGDKVVVQVPPVSIDVDNEKQWEALRKTLLAKLSAESFRTNLGFTDHLGALIEAKRILDKMRENWRPNERHYQVVFMLTDGEWYLPCPKPAQPSEAQASKSTEISQPWYCKDGEFNRDAYVKKLDEYIRENMPPNRYLFYVGAINDRSREWWSYVSKWWEKWTNGHAKRLETNTMWGFFDGILSNLTVNDPVLGKKKSTEGNVEAVPIEKGRVEIPPYLQRVTFIVHKPHPDARVRIYQPDGTLVDTLPTTRIIGADSFIERIIVENPQPGFMRIERPQNAEIKYIYMIKVEAEVNCEVESLLYQYIPTRFKCTVSRRDGKPLPPYTDPRYRLQIEARIKTGEGTERIPLSLNPTSQSEYEAFWLPIQPGKYNLNIVASTQKPSGELFSLFGWPKDGSPWPLTVEQTHPRLEPVSPPLVLVPFEVRISLIDSKGLPVSVPKYASNAFHMRLKMLASSPRVEKVMDLVPSSLPTGESLYKGTALLAYPTTYTVYVFGEITHPVTGKRVKAFQSTEVGSITVQAPVPAWNGFDSPWPQYKKAKISFYLADSTGHKYADKIDLSQWKVYATVMVKEPSGEKMPIEVTSKEPGSWEGEFAPQVDGEHTIVVSVGVEHISTGQKIPFVTEMPLFVFTVTPMTKVSCAILAPQDGGTFVWRDILWRPRPLRIEVGIQNVSGDLLDPKDVFVHPQSPLRVEVIASNGKRFGPLSLLQGDKPGKYLAKFDNYEPYRWNVYQDLGWYEIHVMPNSKLKPTYILPNEEGTRIRVHLVRHPLWWILPTILAVLFILLCVLFAIQSYVRLWSIQGILVHANTGRTLARLTDYGKHTVTITSNLPPEVEKVRIHQHRGQRRVTMTVWAKRHGKTIKIPRYGNAPVVAGVRFQPLSGGDKPQPVFSLSVLFYGVLSFASFAGLIWVLSSVVQSLR